MLKNRTWFTEGTEILTTDGWVDISLLHKIEEVISLGEQLERGSITEFNKYYYRGDIKHYKGTDINFKCKTLHAPNLWRVGTSLELPVPRDIKYEGFLYNVVTNKNNLIVRSNNNDYILTTCING